MNDFSFVTWFDRNLFLVLLAFWSLVPERSLFVTSDQRSGLNVWATLGLSMYRYFVMINRRDRKICVSLLVVFFQSFSVNLFDVGWLATWYPFVLMEFVASFFQHIWLRQLASGGKAERERVCDEVEDWECRG